MALIFPAMVATVNRWFKRAQWVLAGLAVVIGCTTGQLQAQSDDNPSGADVVADDPLAAVFPDGRHLASLSLSSIDAFDSDVDIWLASYSYAPNRKFRFTLQAPWVTISDLPPIPGQPDRFTGLGDASMLIQYDPRGNLSANAFVPDTLGLTLGIQFPSGDFRKGLGKDAWAASVGGGWLVDFFKDSWLIPSITYTQSFDEGGSEFEVQRADLELGAYWLFRNAAWVGLVPTLGYDWVEDGWRLDASLVVGKAWQNGIAVDLSWGFLDRIDAFARRDDRVAFAQISYQFGAPSAQ